MTNYDLALPKDAPEMQFLRESDKHRVYYYPDRHGNTVYQGQFKMSYGGIGWWDDSDCCTYDEDVALDWFEDAVNPSVEVD